MGPRKINDNKLLQMIDQGYTQVEISKSFGVSKQAVSKRLKDVGGRTTKIVVAKQSKKIVEKSFDAIEQLTEINKKSLGLLDQAEKDPQFALKCIGELRNQIRLAKDIQETLYSQKEAMKFMEIVADTLREVSDDAYKQFIRKINHEKSIRSVLRFT